MSLKFLDPLGQLPADSRADLERGFGSLMNADYKDAFQAFEVCSRHESDLVRGFAFLYLGDLHHFHWDFRLCLQSYQKAEELVEAVDHGRGRIMVWMRIADIYIDQADTSGDGASDELLRAKASSWDVLNRALADAERLGDDFLQGFGHHYRALFFTEAGEFVEAKAAAERAVEIRESIGDTVYAPSTMALLARAKAELGEFDEAIELAEQTFQIQMERNLRGAGLRTLTILSYINDLRLTQRTKNVTSQFTAVEPIARTPYLLAEHSDRELAVAAHAVSDETPLMAASGAISTMRQALVADRNVAVMALQS